MQSVLETANGFVNLAAAFYLREARLGSGRWEIIRGGSKPGVRSNDFISGEAFEKWFAQLPAGWVEIYSLDQAHVVINLAMCAGAYTNGPAPKKGYVHTLTPSHSVLGPSRFEDDLQIRTKEESLTEIIASSDLPAVKRVRYGMKELQQEIAS